MGYINITQAQLDSLIQSINKRAALSGATFTGPVIGTTFTGALTGNATTATTANTATKLATPRTINGVEFDGSANITVEDSTKQPLDADLTAIAALTGTSGLLKKTAANTWVLDASAYVTSSGVTSVTGTAPIVSSGGTTPVISISEATTSAPGSMSAADKAKLDGISGTTYTIAEIDAIVGDIASALDTINGEVI